MEQPYEWSGLADESADSIRLLCIYSADTHDALLFADLLESNLSADPDFVAVSDSSGQSETSERLHIGERGEEGYLCIEQSVASLLRHQRDQTEGSDGRVLWIASICVNPTDAKERVAQAARRGRIFRRARTVLEWPARKDSCAASSTAPRSSSSTEDASTTPNRGEAVEDSDEDGLHMKPSGRFNRTGESASENDSYTKRA